MSRTRLALLVVVGLLCAPPAWGFIHFVCTDTTLCTPDPILYPDPGDYAEYESIATALGAAASADSVFVTRGVYYESVGLVSGVLLRGGYDYDFTTYLPGTFISTINGSSTTAGVTANASAGPGTILEGFTITDAGGTTGAAVVVVGGEVIVRDCRITNNRNLGLAGGVYVNSGATVRLENNRISGNASLGSGGGVRVAFSTLEMIGNTISGNTAVHFGGGLYAVASEVVCTSNVFEGNSAGTGGGAAHFEETSTPVTFSGDDFLLNSGGFGGAIWLKNESIAEIEDADFTGNHATVSGGAIALHTLSEVTTTDCRFTDCTAGARGGAIFALEAFVTVLGTDPSFGSSAGWFSGCTADTTGGAIYARLSSGEISGARFTGCRADSMGGGFFISQSQFTITENLVDECESDEGGGIALQGDNTSCPQSHLLNNTVSRCSGTGDAGEHPAGGITVAGVSTHDIALLAGNIVSHILQGTGIRCRRGSASATGTGRPTIRCSSFHNEPGNTEDPVYGNNCTAAFDVDTTNRSGVDPLHCGTTDYRLQVTSPEVGSNCAQALPGRANRGYTDETCTVPPPQAIQASSWGRIKSRYR
jgi:predicted outer membrane repeat protein